MAHVFSQEIYGPEGPALDTDIDQIEDVAVLAAKAAFDAVIAQALELQNQQLPEKLPCRPVLTAKPIARSATNRGPSKAGSGRPPFENRFAVARVVTGIFFPQREALRLDSQNVTPRARRKVVHAGGHEKSFGVGSRSLSELAEWDLKSTRVAEHTLQAGREMKQQQTG